MLSCPGWCVCRERDDEEKLTKAEQRSLTYMVFGKIVKVLQWTKEYIGKSAKWRVFSCKNCETVECH
jgi:hypothetical protein